MLGSLAVILNFVQLILLQKRAPKKSSFEVILFSLGLSDLAFGLCSITMATGALQLKWNIRIAMDFVRSVQILTSFTGTVTLFHISVISLDRFIGVILPFQHRDLVSTKRTVALLMTGWVVSLMLSLTLLIEGIGEIFVKISVGFVVLDSFIIFMLYIFLVSKVRCMSRKFSTSADSQIHQQRLLKKRERHVLANSLAVTVAFIICLYPPIFFVAFEEYGTYFRIWPLMTLQCVVDPVIYFFTVYGIKSQ